MAETVKLKLSPPWITYVNKIKALFGNDPDVNIVYDDVNDNVSALTLKLYVANEKKAKAIYLLLPDEEDFGNVCLTIDVFPPNSSEPFMFSVFEEDFSDEFSSDKELFDCAFNRNPIYAFTKEITGFFSNILTYVVFKNRVVQFFNDNLNDIHGLVSTLYQDVASEVFDEYKNVAHSSIFFNTDVEEKIGMPLGEWP